MRRWWCVALLMMAAVGAWAVTLEQVISRENTGFDAAAARLVVGRDGRVYFSHTGDPGYALSMLPDGSARLGFAMGHATEVPAVNAEGTYCLRQGHFAHTAAVTARDGQTVGTFSDLNNDNYDAPQDIAVGASGDFYLLDGRTTNRVIRVSGATAKAIGIYTLPKPQNMYFELQVSEAAQRFYLSDWASPVKIVGFDGKLAGTFPWSGPHAIADDGSIWVLPTRGDLLTHYDAAGKQLGTLKLDVGERKWSGDNLYFTYIGLLPGGEIAVKRNHPSELFARYDLATGAYKGAVNCQYEKLTVTYPSAVWTAGEATPLTLTFDSGGRATAPAWQVWITPFGAADWQALPYVHGQVTLPPTFGGLYQLKVSPELAGWQGGEPSEYLVHDVIEVRRADSHGTLNVLTPGNRVHYGRGEAIPLTVLARAAELPATATLEVWDTGQPAQPLYTQPLPLAGKTTAFTLPARFTEALRPASYRIMATAPKFTPVAQVIELGPGLGDASSFRIMLHGDYGATRPTGDVWTAPDMTRAHLKWAEMNALNFFVDRANFTFGLDWANNNSGRPFLNALKDRLGKDPLGVAPEKAELLFPDGETLAAYGAAGMSHMSLLCNMDAGLPLGTGFDGRTKEQFADNIVKHTNALKPFPGWQGWDWVANWWIFDYDKRFKDAEEKKSYQAAWKKAEETGAWDPVLETVADRGINWQVEAQQFFNDTLRAASPGSTNASSGPYRRPDIYSPISFANVAQTDLQYQAEQITTPYWTATAYDFYHRPGKPAWLHPEMWNDTGTGEQVLPMTWLGLMRGADGIGNSGFFPNWGQQPLDWRNGYHGLPSVYRNLFNQVAPLGPWLQTLEPRDTVALLISRRMLKTDPWTGIGGRYFTRQWEAYMSFLYAHVPARWVYLEDVTPETWKHFKAVVAVGQRFEPEPEWSAALQAAKAAGLAIYADGACRPDLVPGATPLGVSFDGIEKLACFNADSAYWTFPERLLANARALAPALAALPAVAFVDQPEVLVSERGAGQGRFIWIVNNTHNPLPQEMLYRVNVAISSQLPVTAQVKLPGAQGKTVYDVFAQHAVTPDAQGMLLVDLRNLDARLYAVLPQPIADLALSGPRQAQAGQAISWGAWVKDKQGHALDTAIPVQMTLTSADDMLGQRAAVAVGEAGATGMFTLPLSCANTSVRLTAKELISGRISTMLVKVLPADPSVLLTEGKTPAPAAMDKLASEVQHIRQATPSVALNGARLRDLAIAPDGQTAYLSALQWGDNLYALDLTTGAVKWQKRVGQYWALGTQSFGGGVAVGGFDFTSAEGYHLYTLAPDGHASHKFAVYGLPTETPALFTITVTPNHPTLGFAVSPAGEWVSASGDLGVAAWSPAGQLLFHLDRWKDGTRHEPLRIAAAGHDGLLVIDGLNVKAYAPKTGQVLWEHALAKDGQVQQVATSGDGNTIALLTTVDGGRVYLIRGGKIIDAVPTGGQEMAISLDGALLAVTHGNQLKLLQSGGGLVWSYSSDSPLHFPLFSRDGSQLAVSSEMGTLLVIDRTGAHRHEMDLSSVAKPAWLANGDLLAVTWLGTVIRYDAAKEFAPRWQTQPQTGGTDNLVQHLLDRDDIPVVRMTGWSNAETADAAPPAPLPGKTRVSIQRDEHGFDIDGDQNRLVDGKLESPAKPYLPVGALNPHNGNGARTSIVFDRGKNLVKLTSITLYEDETHPESWLRDVELELWDAPTRTWLPVRRLLSDQPVHIHLLAKPVEGSRFRLLLPPFPNSNIRLKEVVLSGEDLGSAWPPDVRDKKPVAVLFDDNLADLAGPYQNGFNMGYQPKNQADSYSGASYFIFDPAKNGGLNQLRPLSDIDAWLHPLAENPQPGQYRWLQLAVKRLSPDFKQLKIWLGHPDVSPFATITLKPVDDWQLLRVDLWALQKRAMNITQLWFGFENGAGAVDQIVLGRTEGDLDGVKPLPKQ